MPNSNSPAFTQRHVFNPLVESKIAISRIKERGRWWILAGWAIAMIGVFFYCRLLFSINADCDMPELLHRTGPAGWAALLLIVAGVIFWLAGNLIYLKDAMNSPEIEPDGTPNNHSTLEDLGPKQS